eukprot:CAMPEP_0197182800 /NCGR_PEP_ID=MMETSP1423-20130617/6817_1 /TAXON_ID=476441 /ORGANISM="Pseudo-nitzschia heimii, Strain UNC1101" /LENGTH=246 /DNA_ID=CAMNT_0042633293 /DNA_START=179 /DNA_END=916 /DNA_ORIENTATION=-
MTPSSWFPSSYPFDFVYDPVLGCPDRHPGILRQLFDAFGAENCVRETISETRRSIECEYIHPNWFRGYALYNYTDSDLEYHTTWKPEKLYISDTHVWGLSHVWSPSGATWIEFTSPQSEGFDRTCMDGEGEAFLGDIRGKRLYPNNAPKCDDTEGEFLVQIRGQEKVFTCDHYWNLGWEKRRKKCSKHEEVMSNCPSICSKFDDYDEDIYSDDKFCVCSDKPFPFSRENLTCADLENLDESALSEW